MNVLPFYLYGWVFFCALLAMAAGTAAALSTSRLMSYIKQHQYAKWRELTSLGTIGPGMSNPLAIWQYLQSELDTTDEQLLRAKDRARTWWRWLLILSLTFLLSMIAVVLIMVLAYARR